MCRDWAACNLASEKNRQRKTTLKRASAPSARGPINFLYFNQLRDGVRDAEDAVATAAARAASPPAPYQAALGRSSRQNRATIAVMTTTAAMTRATQPGQPACAHIAAGSAAPALPPT